MPVSDLNCPDLEPTTITKWVATRDEDRIPYLWANKGIPEEEIAAQWQSIDNDAIARHGSKRVLYCRFCKKSLPCGLIVYAMSNSDVMRLRHQGIVVEKCPINCPGSLPYKEPPTLYQQGAAASQLRAINASNNYLYFRLQEF